MASASASDEAVAALVAEAAQEGVEGWTGSSRRDSVADLVARIDASAKASQRLVEEIEGRCDGGEGESARGTHIHCYATTLHLHKAAGGAGGGVDSGAEGLAASDTDESNAAKMPKRSLGRARSSRFMLEQEAARGWSLVNAPQRREVLPEVEGWRYDGPALSACEDIFNDKLDFTVAGFADLKRLTGRIPPVARKFARLADVPQNRDDVRNYLRNMLLVEAAVMQVAVLTRDAEDNLSDSKALRVAMQKIQEQFAIVQGLVPRACLEIVAEPPEGSDLGLASYDQFVEEAAKGYDEYDDSLLEEGW